MRYAKTQAGQEAFKSRSQALTPRQRSAFILFDGRKTLDDVLAMTAGLGVLKEDVDHMVAAGLLEAVSPGPATEAQPVFTTSPTQAQGASPGTVASGLEGLTLAERYARAWPIATQLTASLGLRGFRLNLAVEAANGYEQLRDLLPRIQEAVGHEKALPLARLFQE